MVGRTIAIDLSSCFEVTCFDMNPENLETLRNRAKVNTFRSDLSELHAYEHILKDFKLVVSAVPGFMGFNTLKKIIQLKKTIVDISFFPENALALDELAKNNKVTAIVDCGVAPGMSNLVLGRYDEEMVIESFHCMVGGLPKLRIKPFEYKAPFSPIDVIEEYTRPARYVEDGKIVTRPALSDAELIDFDHAGTLESFNTDGLRSILYTMNHIPNMKEKTLRYPGHIALVQALKQAGFFEQKEILVNDQKVKPIDFTSKLLFDQWKLQPGEEEFTIMQIEIKGSKNGKAVTVKYFLYDEYDAATQTSSMSRTTAYTCTAAVNMITEGFFSEHGIIPPEKIGRHKKCFDYILKYLADRNVIYKKTVD